MSHSASDYSDLIVKQNGSKIPNQIFTSFPFFLIIHPPLKLKSVLGPWVELWFIFWKTFVTSSASPLFFSPSLCSVDSGGQIVLMFWRFFHQIKGTSQWYILSGLCIFLLTTLNIAHRVNNRIKYCISNISGGFHQIKGTSQWYIHGWLGVTYKIFLKWHGPVLYPQHLFQ